MVDDAKLHQFMGQMLSDLGGAASVALVRIGDALGLYKTLHERGPMTVTHDPGSKLSRDDPSPPVTLTRWSTEAFVLIRGSGVAYRPDTGSPNNCHRVAIGFLGYRGATSGP
jgi:hypothetical protein